MPYVDGLFIDHFAEFGIVLEKNFTLQFAYKFLNKINKYNNIQKILNPLWGQEIIYFNCNNYSYVIISAQGAPFAANAVERLKRTGVKYIISIGSSGSTDESIKPGQYILASAAVRNEGTTTGYLDKTVPAISDININLILKKEFRKKNIFPRIGVVFTTDQRYKENPDLLRSLYKHANVVCIDMETAAILVTGMYHRISVTSIKIITDCAVKSTNSRIQGIFEEKEDYFSWIRDKLIIALEVALDTFPKLVT